MSVSTGATERIPDLARRLIQRMRPASSLVSAWGDALALAITEMRGCTWKDVLCSHPGGAVGQRAVRSEDS